MISVMRISEMYDKDVFTDAGEYFGKISDVILGKFMIHGWVIRSTPQSMLKEALSNVHAVIVPHKAVRAIGDIVIISHNIEISKSESADEGEETAEVAPQAPPAPQQPRPQMQAPQPPRRYPFQ